MEPPLLLFESVPFPGDLSLPRMPPVHLSPFVTTVRAGIAYTAACSQCIIYHTIVIYGTGTDRQISDRTNQNKQKDKKLILM